MTNHQQGVWAMRYVIGFIVGVVLTIGGAWLYDTAGAGTASPLVNWTTANNVIFIGLWRGTFIELWRIANLCVVIHVIFCEFWRSIFTICGVWPICDSCPFSGRDWEANSAGQGQPSGSA